MGFSGTSVAARITTDVGATEGQNFVNPASFTQIHASSDLDDKLQDWSMTPQPACSDERRDECKAGQLGSCFREMERG